MSGFLGHIRSRGNTEVVKDGGASPSTKWKTDGRQVTKEGWLQKEGGAARSKWQNRWFRLQGKTVNYFTKKEDSSPQGTINLDDVKDISKIGEHSGKPHCLALVTTKGGGKKVYYLSADTEDLMNEWYGAFQANMAQDAPMKLLKYATAEVFLTQGVRITGDVNYDILSAISHRLGPDKKKRDHFGWYCDRTMTLAAILNLFAEYGWVPDRIYRSTAVSGTDSTVQPVNRVIFSKSPLPPSTLSESGGKSNKRFKMSPHSSPLLGGNRNEGSGKFQGSGDNSAGFTDSMTISSMTVGSYTSSKGKLLEGVDEELVDLMKEFDIPLTLLEVPPE